MEKYKKKYVKESEVNDLSMLPIDEIDLAPLEKEVSRRIGVSVKFKLRTEKRRKEYLVVTSQELAHKTGIFEEVMKSCVMETFNSAVSTEESDYVWWQTINYSFSYKSGGSNGTDLLTAWYNFTTKKWTFR